MEVYKITTGISGYNTDISTEIVTVDNMENVSFQNLDFFTSIDAVINYINSNISNITSDSLKWRKCSPKILSSYYSTLPDEFKSMISDIFDEILIVNPIETGRTTYNNVELNDTIYNGQSRTPTTSQYTINRAYYYDYSRHICYPVPTDGITGGILRAFSPMRNDDCNNYSANSTYTIEDYSIELDRVYTSSNIVENNKFILKNKIILLKTVEIILFYRGYETNKYGARINTFDYRTVNNDTVGYYIAGTEQLNNQPIPVTQTDISDAQVIIESDYFFTGNPIIPTSVNVYLDGTQLVQDVDYTVGVTNNTYVGEANVNIAGIGNYTGTKQAHFTIARAHIDTANISVDGTSFPYTGQEIEPTVTITMGGYTAQRSVDYVLRYSDNINIGTGSIQIDTGPAIELGTGNFQGTATITFQITGNDSPYEPGGTTEPEIGPTDGDWELINNPLDLSYTNHNDLSLGLFRAYAMDKTQLSNFGKTLWRPSILQSITALLSNPLDTIISLGSFPFIIDATTSSETIEFNWIDDWIPDGWQFAPTGHPLRGEYETFSFGTVTIPRYSGTFYDFQPYTQAQIYIPYIGYVNVKANEIIGKQIELQYHVNLITGDFTAIVFLSNRLAPQIIGEYQGNMLRELPLSMSTFVNFVGTAIKTTAIAGAAVAAFGAAAPLAATAGESAKNLFEDSLIQSDMGNYSHASILRNQANQIEKTASNIVKRDARRAGIAIGASAIGLITSANQPIPRNGTIGAVSGRTSTQEAFVSLSLPHQNIPSNQAMLGYPTNLPGPLSKFSGYTVVRDIHVKSSTALYSELIEIEKVVRGGIVI